ncbi:CTP synthetase [Rhodobacter sp. Har01]|uniref:CTP synthetase n=1 Tax=Rhodobacter sp. Har01 TaxID=2883999 RepID=UPI001D073B86|nr:CTP synthetase [Rhodobacter sp. Har01]MCB6178204.1 CTP synthetase [Rhodobacter sp. Har01]
MRLFLLLYPVIGTTLAGIAMVVALTMGMDTLRPIVISAAIGAAIGLPVTWLVAKKVATI